MLQSYSWWAGGSVVLLLGSLLGCSHDEGVPVSSRHFVPAPVAPSLLLAGVAANEPAAESQAEAASQEEGTEQSRESQAHDAKSQKSTRVRLGTPELTQGIPGEGPLTLEEIRKWLDQPENHVPLEVELPLGLSQGAANIFIPEDNPITRAKIELGRQLYFDPRLSADATVSCASCHDPEQGYTKPTQFGIGIGGLEGNRNSPVAYNRILSKHQFWDGRAPALEDQAIGPIANPIEMGSSHEACVACLRGIDGYRIQFERIFPEQGLTIATVGKALASFERVIVTGPAPFDYYEPLRAFEASFAEDLEDLETLREEDPQLYEQYQQLRKASEEHPMSESARRGRDLFFGKAQCSACHVGANFTDEQFHNLGVGMTSADPDLGRYSVAEEKDDKLRGAFKTPTLRNVTLTAPYMHDGSLSTLDAVIDFYDKGGEPNPYLSDKMQKLNLTDQEKRDLVEFLKALEGEFPPVESGRLPE